MLDGDGTEAGVVRWAVGSYALDRPIAIALVDEAAADGDTFIVRCPDGERIAKTHAIPFVQ